MSYQIYHHNRNYGCRISEFVLAGHRAVSLENEKLRVTVLADKGSDIYEFLYKPRDMDFLWRSWVGLRARDHLVATTSRSAGPHQDHYEGGWQEMFPNCGGRSEHQRAEIGQHGEVLLLPWDYSIRTDEPDLIEVEFRVRTIRTPFHLVKVLSLRRNEAILRISETATNESGQDVDFTWGHHPALGWPFLNQTCRIDLPECRIRTFPEFTTSESRLKADQTSEWPLALGIDGSAIDLSQIGGPELACQDMVFLDGISDGWYAVTNLATRTGFALIYPAEVMRYLWYWLVCRGGRDYPWWSATYNLALEPCATLPILSRAVERGEALLLGPGQQLHIDLAAIAYEGIEKVISVDKDGNVSGSPA